VIPAWSDNPSLPKGKWRNLMLLDTPSESDGYQARLKQRAGSVITLTGESIQTTESFDPDKLKLLIAPDESYQASGQLYVDAGDGFGYRDGEYEWNLIQVAPSGDDSLLVTIELEAGNPVSEDRAYLPGIVTNYGVFYEDWKTGSSFKIPLKPDLFIDWVHPQNGDQFEENTAIAFQVLTEGDFPIQKVVYRRQNGETIGEAVEKPWSFEWIDAPKGEYTIAACATSPEGYEVRTEFIDITVGNFGSGEITYQQWFELGSGVEVIHLTGHPDYPENPDRESYLESFETPKDIDDNFGARIIGYLHPPVTGTYRFSITGDDFCELWLSSDSSPEKLERIAHVPGWTSPGEWTKYPEQQSSSIFLSNENKYLIMGLQKEAGGNDHLTVAWEYQGKAREIIDGFYLSPDDGSSLTHYVEQEIFFIYPNPTSDDLFIDTKGHRGKLSIIDQKGNILRDVVIQDPAGKRQIPVEDFTQGWYTIRFETLKQEIYTKNFVITR
jgi:hypothetical protein